jgi:hypothetical protein
LAKDLLLLLGVLLGLAGGIGYFFHVNLLEWAIGEGWSTLTRAVDR